MITVHGSDEVTQDVLGGQSVSQHAVLQHRQQLCTQGTNITTTRFQHCNMSQ